MKSIRNLPINFEILHDLLEKYSFENEMSLSFKHDDLKANVKLFKPGFPIRIDFYQTKSGLTVSPGMGKDITANLKLVEYIENQINHERLISDRATFREVSVSNIKIVMSKIEDFCISNEIGFRTSNTNSTRIIVNDPIINNATVVEFYNNGTIYLFGYNTPLFDEIYNIIYSCVKKLPQKTSKEMQEIVDFAKKQVLFANTNECRSCAYIEKCKRNGKRFLNYCHFEREVSKYPCRTVTSTYVCRYIYRYSSEIQNLIKLNDNFFGGLDKINILSIGCGASPDYLAVKSLYEKKTIKYIGIDYNENWDIFHNYFILKNNEKNQASFYRMDIYKIIDQLNREEKELEFNLVIMNYVVSSMVIDNSIDELCQIFKKIKERILDHMKIGGVLIVNDINNSKHFVDIMEEVLFRNIFENYKVDKYFHKGRNRRYLSTGNAITETDLHFYINSDVSDMFNSQLECNSAAYQIRRLQ